MKSKDDRLTGLSVQVRYAVVTATMSAVKRISNMIVCSDAGVVENNFLLFFNFLFFNLEKSCTNDYGSHEYCFNYSNNILSSV